MQLKLDAMYQRDAADSLKPPELSEKELDEMANRYQIAKIPWDNMWKYHLYKLAEKRRYMCLRVYLPAELQPHGFEIPTISSIVDEFFKNKKPLYLPHLGQYVDYWIFYFVTSGRIRSDHNKKTRRFNYPRGDMGWVVWSSILKNSNPSDWTLVEDEDVYPLICSISDTCNAVLTAIRRQLQGIQANTACAQVSGCNLNHHPEFVPFQQNRGGQHKQFRWKFQRLKRGGNAGFKAPHAPLILPKHSIHQMMRELHEWLPSLRTRK